MSDADLIAEARSFLGSAGKATLVGRLTDALEAAWTVDPHDTSDNTTTIEHAADHLNELLGES